MTIKNILHTGLQQCYDERGKEIDCDGTGQDGEKGSGLVQSGQRFVNMSEFAVKDELTGLVWTTSASKFEFPVSWRESLALVAQMNNRKEFGRSDWRLPNRRELRSLVDHAMKNPSLPRDHPFIDVNLGWYWTSTTAAPNRSYAWYLHLEGGRMFYGKKTDFFWAWPVAGKNMVLPQTGEHISVQDQDQADGTVYPVGADGCTRSGTPWPEPRFQMRKKGVLDMLTGLLWYQGNDFIKQCVTWSESFAAVQEYAQTTDQPWRVPTINELESLVDVSRHRPALPPEHTFPVEAHGFWSSTTSGYEKDWSYVLYMDKGAVGVGYKKNRDFYLWPVSSAGENEGSA